MLYTYSWTNMHVFSSIYSMYQWLVTVPPDILDAESSKDITVTEGQNASLYCSASGNPQPSKLNRLYRFNLDSFEGESAEKMSSYSVRVLHIFFLRCYHFNPEAYSAYRWRLNESLNSFCECTLWRVNFFFLVLVSHLYKYFACRNHMAQRWW